MGSDRRRRLRFAAALSNDNIKKIPQSKNIQPKRLPAPSNGNFKSDESGSCTFEGRTDGGTHVVDTSAVIEHSEL